jgi:hypothetical protein
MPFSRSTFTVEIDDVPTFVFQAKPQIEAEVICSEWCAQNLQRLIELNIIGARAATKVRIARSDERAKYETEVLGVNNNKETVPLVYLKKYLTSFPPEELGMESILVRRDQFNITPQGIVHKPTDAGFTPDPGDPHSGIERLGQLGNEHPSGFRSDDVLRMMRELRAEYVVNNPQQFKK